MKQDLHSEKAAKRRDHLWCIIMIPTIRLEKIHLNVYCDISQKDNHNSCTGLFITEDRKHIIKLFDGIEYKIAGGISVAFHEFKIKGLSSTLDEFSQQEKVC